MMTLPPILSISIHLPLRPTLIHHRTVRTCLCLRLCLSIPPLIFHLSPSLLPSSIHPLLVLEAHSMMTGLSNTFSSPSLSLSIHPPRVPLHLCAFIIFSRSPAELASVSEPSPPQTWRPRSPAPRRGSELLRSERDRDSYRKQNSRLCDTELLSGQACTHTCTHILS